MLDFVKVPVCNFTILFFFLLTQLFLLVQVRGPEMDLPVHLEHDGAVDDGEAEHPHPAQQDAPEGAGPEVHDEDLQRHPA